MTISGPISTPGYGAAQSPDELYQAQLNAGNATYDNTVGADKGGDWGTAARANVMRASGRGGLATISGNYGGYEGGAAAAQQHYNTLAQQQLNRQGAQIVNPYAADDRARMLSVARDNRNAAFAAPQAYYANGQNLAQAQFNAAMGNALQQQVAAQRGGGGMAAAQAAHAAMMGGVAGRGNALNQAGQTYQQQQTSLAGLRNGLLGNTAQAYMGLQGYDQQSAYQQAQLQQAQNALNQSGFNQLEQLGQNAQLSDLTARGTIEAQNVQRAQAQAQQNMRNLTGATGAATSFTNYAAQAGG